MSKFLAAMITVILFTLSLGGNAQAECITALDQPNAKLLTFCQNAGKWPQTPDQSQSITFQSVNGVVKASADGKYIGVTMGSYVRVHNLANLSGVFGYGGLANPSGMVFVGGKLVVADQLNASFSAWDIVKSPKKPTPVKLAMTGASSVIAIAGQAIAFDGTKKIAAWSPGGQPTYVTANLTNGDGIIGGARANSKIIAVVYPGQKIGFIDLPSGTTSGFIATGLGSALLGYNDTSKVGAICDAQSCKHFSVSTASAIALGCTYARRYVSSIEVSDNGLIALNTGRGNQIEFRNSQCSITGSVPVQAVISSTFHPTAPQTCTPSTTQPCYTGPTNTENVGECKAGTQTCNAQGTAWGACQGDTTPATETCNGKDDDCDGVIDNSGQLSNCCNGQPCQEPTPEPPPADGGPDTAPDITPDAGPDTAPDTSPDGGPGDTAPDTAPDAGPDTAPDAGPTDTAPDTTPDTTPAPDIAPDTTPDTTNPTPKELSCSIGKGKVVSGKATFECGPQGRLIARVYSGDVVQIEGNTKFATFNIKENALIRRELSGGVSILEGRPQFARVVTNGAKIKISHKGVTLGVLGTDFIFMESRPGYFRVQLNEGAVTLSYYLEDTGETIQVVLISEKGLSPEYSLADLEKLARAKEVIKPPPPKIGCGCSQAQKNNNQAPLPLLALMLIFLLGRRRK